MKIQITKLHLLAISLVVLSCLIGLGYTCFKLKNQRDDLASTLSAANHRGTLLEQKYKEQKAEVGRLQSDKLVLDGQARKLQADLEKLAEENQNLNQKMTELEASIQQKVSGCDKDRERMLASYDKLKSAYEELKEMYRETRIQLKTSENSGKEMTAAVASLKTELSRTIQTKDRYLAHNAALSNIAKSLVGRIEKKELGTTILVKEPLVQFERLDLEQMLQEYLDKIDDEKILP